MNTDEDVRATNSEAAVSKFSCVMAGYFEDEFLKYFVPNPVRRNPIINKGYYVRVSVLRRVYREFLDSFPSGCQIVVLGAGTDTNGLHAIKNYPENKEIRIFEVDFPETIYKKLRVIQKHSNDFPFLDIQTASIQSTYHGSVWSLGPQLSLIAHDLREPLEEFEKKLAAAGFNRERPTLFVSECVLIYLDMAESDRVIEWVAKHSVIASTPRMLAIYEQICPNDAFGKMMMENLANRGCPLRSIVNSPSAMHERLSKLGFADSRTELMNHFDPIVRLKRPEIIDELEEYNLLQSHYGFTLAWSSDMSSTASNVFGRNDNE